MRARAAILVLWSLLGPGGPASAGDPKPTTIDTKPFRDKLLVFEDTTGGTYLVLPGEDSRVWFAKNGKTAHEQIVVTRSSDGGAGTWSYGVWAPRISGLSPASIQREADGTFNRFCGDDNK